MNPYIELLRPKNAAMAVVAVLVAELIAWPAEPKALVLGPLAASLILAGGNALNDYFDRDVDAVNHPERPIPSGRITPMGALVASGVAFSTGIAASALIGADCLLTAIFAVILLIFYEWKLKARGMPGNASISLLVSLLFVFGGLAATWSRHILVLAGMAFLANMGRELDKDLEDVAGDVNRRTFPRLHGRKATIALSTALYASAVAISPLPYLLGDMGAPYVFTVLAADSAFLYCSLLKDPSRRQKVAKLGMVIGLIAFLVGGLP